MHMVCRFCMTLLSKVDKSMLHRFSCTMLKLYALLACRSRAKLMKQMSDAENVSQSLFAEGEYCIHTAPGSVLQTSITVALTTFCDSAVKSASSDRKVVRSNPTTKLTLGPWARHLILTYSVVYLSCKLFWIKVSTTWVSHVLYTSLCFSLWSLVSCHFV